MKPEVREWLLSDEGVAWLAGAFAGWLVSKPWKVSDEDAQILENREVVREAIQHGLDNPEWVERSELSASPSAYTSADEGENDAP